MPLLKSRLLWVIYSYLAVFLVAGCDATSQLVARNPQTPQMTVQSAQNGSLGTMGSEVDFAFEASLLLELNRVRLERGLGAVRRNGLLDQSAQKYAQVLAAAGRIAHDGVDGTTLSDRIDATGYIYRYFNENLSAGYPTAELVVNAWLKSPGHRDNLFHLAIVDVGLGYAHRNTQWTHYWVMVGAQPF